MEPILTLAMSLSTYRQTVIDSNQVKVTDMIQAKRITDDPGPLLAALAEAGVLEATEDALIHYSYGVNSGTLMTRNTPESIANTIYRHEQKTMGPINVDAIKVRTRYEHVTEWIAQ